ncbi:hypothetical protein Q5752_003754 [Cryptotrichosporon argae]
MSATSCLRATAPPFTTRPAAPAPAMAPRGPLLDSCPKAYDPPSMVLTMWTPRGPALCVTQIGENDDSDRPPSPDTTGARFLANARKSADAKRAHESDETDRDDESDSDADAAPRSNYLIVFHTPDGPVALPRFLPTQPPLEPCADDDDVESTDDRYEADESCNNVSASESSTDMERGEASTSSRAGMSSLRSSLASTTATALTSISASSAPPNKDNTTELHRASQQEHCATTSNASTSPFHLDPETAAFCPRYRVGLGAKRARLISCLNPECAVFRPRNLNEQEHNALAEKA